jgi:putative DNA primase/helicase
MTIFDATERLRERVHAADEATGQHGEWPGPLPLPNELPPVEPFPPEILPPALAPWLIDVAERMQCPLDIPAAAALVCLGSVIGRRCGIRPRRRDSWLVVPNLWGAVVGRPAS